MTDDITPRGDDVRNREKNSSSIADENGENGGDMNTNGGKKINILFVIPTMNSGGVETGMMEFAQRNYENRDINIFLVSAGGILINRLKHYGVKYIEMPVDSKNPLVMFRNALKLKKVIQNYKIDMLQVESRAPAWSCLHACKATKIPLITVVQFNGLFKKNSFLKRKYNSVMFRGNPLIMVSQAVKNKALHDYKYILRQKRLLKTVIVVHRGIDPHIYSQSSVNLNRKLMLQRELQLPEDRITIVVPARFAKQKGQEYFLNVLKFLKNCNYTCLLVGDINKNPSYVERIKKLIYKFNLQNFVRICGNISDMPALYSLSNVVVCPSITPEAFGRVSIEAQSMGKIFVGTAMGGTLETVIDKKTGFLVPENNAREFARILDDVMSLSVEEMETIQQNARENVVNNFTFNLMYDRMLSIYKKIATEEDFYDWVR